MQPFDVGTIHRVAQEIEATGKRMQQVVNSPNELTMELQRLQSSMDSLQSFMRNTNAAGGNANTAQTVPDQNQS